MLLLSPDEAAHVSDFCESAAGVFMFNGLKHKRLFLLHIYCDTLIRVQLFVFCTAV